MENDRIKEITAFVNDFNKRLELSEEEQLIKESTMRRIQGRNRSKLNKAIYQKEYSFSHKSKNTKKKFELNKDILSLYYLGYRILSWGIILINLKN